jgi:hypothetical protein
MAKWLFEHIMGDVDPEFSLIDTYVDRRSFKLETNVVNNRVQQQIRHAECPTLIKSLMRRGPLKSDYLTPIRNNVEGECAMKYLDILVEEGVIS